MLLLLLLRGLMCCIVVPLFVCCVSRWLVGVAGKTYIVSIHILSQSRTILKLEVGVIVTAAAPRHFGVILPSSISPPTSRDDFAPTTAGET